MALARSGGLEADLKGLTGQIQRPAESGKEASFYHTFVHRP